MFLKNKPETPSIIDKILNNGMDSCTNSNSKAIAVKNLRMNTYTNSNLVNPNMDVLDSNY